MSKSETQTKPHVAEETTNETTNTLETEEERDGRELAEMEPDLKAAFDKTWEQNLPALRYLADR